jgi:hypothetical protein
MIAVDVKRAALMAALQRKAAIIAVATFMTSACSVIQPHVNVPVDTSNPPVLFAGDLNAQIIRAKLTQQLYMDAVSDQSLLTNSLAITAIPLSAAALAVGITNPGTTSTRNFLTGAGLGVATALGVGSFLVDRRRDAIYYQGAREIYCLALAISPLAIEESEFERMRRDVEDLRLNLADAAAAGVQATLVDQGNKVFAAGRELVRNIAQAGPIFSNELDKINIAVNAQIASEEHNIGDIAAAISVIQKTPLSVPSGAPAAKTQGGRALSATSAEARLRRSIELVTSWQAVYQGTVTATTAKLQASQCIPSTAASLLQAQPIVVVANGQSVTITSAGQDNTTTGSASVITVQTPQAPPPKIRQPVTSTEPPPDEMSKLRHVFGLTSTEATFLTSRRFQDKVKSFQNCLNDKLTDKLPVTGSLTVEQKGLALLGTDSCLPINMPPGTAPTGSAPGGGATGQPTPPRNR